MELTKSFEISQIDNKGESLVADYLIKNSPKDWIILYSKIWLWKKYSYNESSIKEGEVDFIVIVPGLGFMCLEVKSARKYKIDRGHWSRWDSKRNAWETYTKSPVHQCRRNLHSLANKLEEKFRGNRLPCAYESAVVFPQGKADAQFALGEDEILVDAGSLDNLVTKIKDSLSARLREGMSGNTKEVEQLLCPPEIKIEPALSLNIGRQERALFSLTQGQFEVLKSMRRNRQLSVIGGAGTGKTILAIRRAQELMDQGLRVVYICFSTKLSDWISSSLKLNRGSVATNYHKLAKQYIKESGLPWPSKGEEIPDEFWITKIHELFLNAIERLGSAGKFDAVIIDESQDFSEEHAMVIHYLWNGNEDGHLYQFGDEKQIVFGGKLFEHEEVPECVLDKNCRNTKQIALICKRIMSDAGVSSDASEIDLLPSGTSPVCINGSKGMHFRKTVIAKTINSWIEEGLRPSQIAVLSPMRTNSLIEQDNDSDEIIKVGGLPFTRNHQLWQKNNACLIDTIKGFKGLESDAVVITDIPEIDTTASFALEDAYVGFSRAKHELVAVSLDDSATATLLRWMKP